MNLLQFPGREIASNRQLLSRFTNRRKAARRFRPGLDGLEGRQLLAADIFLKIEIMNPASLEAHPSTGPMVEKKQIHGGIVDSHTGVVADVQKVRDAAVIVSDVQKVRETANAIQAARLGTGAATGGQFYFRE
jgi:hypothetical protein